MALNLKFLSRCRGKGWQERQIHRICVRPHWNVPMPRYFFNTRIGDELVADTDGEMLRNPDRAWEVARDMIRELLRTEGANAALLSAVIEVTDEEGDVVLEFPFSEAIFDMPAQSLTRH